MERFTLFSKSLVLFSGQGSKMLLVLNHSKGGFFMRKLIVLTAMLFVAGFTANLWAESAIGGSAKPNIQNSTGTQADQAQVAESLKGEGDTGNAGRKGKVFPKVQFDHKVQKAQLDHKVPLDHKGWSDKKYKLDHKDQLRTKGFHKGEKGFHKGEKGFLKGDKGLKKYNSGKNAIILQGGKEGKPNEIDDEVTWGKNKGLDAKNAKKGFLKYKPADGKVGGAGNQMPVVK
jgi:hypothetical protein